MPAAATYSVAFASCPKASANQGPTQHLPVALGAQVERFLLLHLVADRKSSLPIRPRSRTKQVKVSFSSLVGTELPPWHFGAYTRSATMSKHSTASGNAHLFAHALQKTKQLTESSRPQNSKKFSSERVAGLLPLRECTALNPWFWVKLEALARSNSVDENLVCNFRAQLSERSSSVKLNFHSLRGGRCCNCALCRAQAMLCFHCEAGSWCGADPPHPLRLVCWQHLGFICFAAAISAVRHL